MMERKCNKDSFHPLATIHHRKASKQIYNDKNKNYTEFKKIKAHTLALSHTIQQFQTEGGKADPRRSRIHFCFLDYTHMNVLLCITGNSGYSLV
jgi:hypothetical protein